MGSESTTGDLQAFLGKVVVVDTDSPLVYLGTLDRVTKDLVYLRDADAHDSRETSTTKERYVLESKRHGLQANRRNVAVRLDRVVSVSLLDDVIEY